ncbi:MAG: NYN domain-containing protein [Candidatus Omnitrophota bacterium]|nr:NYN domain-containing protein [Candidatus Omnitrophota bacterium]
MGELFNNYAFIDSQNLNLSIKDQGWRLDYKRFCRYLKDKYKVSKAFLFIGYIPAQQALYTALQQQGYALVFKPTLDLKGGRVKGNVDAELVLHAMIEWNNYDKAVVVTGDGDFHCLIEHLKNNGKLERLLVPNQYKYSALLKKFGSDITFVTDLKERLGYLKQ